MHYVINLPHLRCTLMGFEKNYQVKILSSQIIQRQRVNNIIYINIYYIIFGASGREPPPPSPLLHTKGETAAQLGGGGMVRNNLTTGFFSKSLRVHLKH